MKKQIRNPNVEIRNKANILNSNDQNARFRVLNIRILNVFRISDFEFRIFSPQPFKSCNPVILFSKFLKSSTPQPLLFFALLFSFFHLPVKTATAQDKPLVIETELGSQRSVIEVGETVTRPALEEREAFVPGQGLDSVPFDEKEIVKTLRMLKKAIEENEKLMRENREMTGRIRILNGQRNIEANRLNAIIVERDAYKQKANQVLELKEQVEAELDQVRARQVAKEEELQETIDNLNERLKQAAVVPEDVEGGLVFQLEQQVSQLTRDLEASREQAALARQYKEQIDDLKTRLTREAQKAETLKDEVGTTREQNRMVKSLNDENRKLREELEELRTAVAQLKDEQAVWQEKEKELARLTDEKSRLEQVKQELDAQVTQKDATLTEVSQTKERLVAVQAELNAQVANFEEMRAADEQEKRDLAGQLARLRQQQAADVSEKEVLAALNQENAQLRAANRDLERQAKMSAQTRPSGRSIAVDLGPATGTGRSTSAQEHTRTGPGTVPERGLSPSAEGDRDAGSPTSAADYAAFADSVSGGKRMAAAVPDNVAPDSRDILMMIEQIGQTRESLNQDAARVHYNMGNSYFHQGRYKAAAAEYRQAVDLAPQDASAHFNLAFVSSEYLYDHEAALKHYNQYLYLNPAADDAMLVREKILEAEIFLRSRIDSHLEGDVQKAFDSLYKN